MPAHCTLLYTPEDSQLQRFFARSGALDSTDLVNAHHAILQLSQEHGGEACALKDLVARSPLKRGKLAACLQLLASFGIVAPVGKGNWRLLDSEVERRQLERLADQSRERRAQQELRLAEMIQYAESDACCWNQVLAYFGEAIDPAAGCGRCHRCVPTPAAA